MGGGLVDTRGGGGGGDWLVVYALCGGRVPDYGVTAAGTVVGGADFGRSGCGGGGRCLVSAGWFKNCPNPNRPGGRYVGRGGAVFVVEDGAVGSGRQWLVAWHGQAGRDAGECGRFELAWFFLRRLPAHSY